MCIAFLALFFTISGAMSWHTIESLDISLFFETMASYFLLTNAWSWFLLLGIFMIAIVKSRFKQLNDHLL
jgi:hypothetical protein